MVAIASLVQAQGAAEIVYVDRVKTYTMPAGDFFIGVFICLGLFVIMVLGIRKLAIYQTKNGFNPQTERVRKALFWRLTD